MSGTYPTSPEFSSLNFTSEYFNLTSQTISGRIQARNIGGQRFRFTAAYPPLSRTEFGPVLAFIMAQKGMAETFTIVLPDISSKHGDASGSVSTSAGAAIGASSVSVTGLSGTLKAGDLIKFANHSKVYMIMSDLTGSGTLSFQPNLVATVNTSEVVTYDSVPFTARLANDIQEMSVGTDLYYSYEVDMIEAI
ncbi:MAG: hypothetical protein ACO23R_02675 [bacterium]